MLSKSWFSISALTSRQRNRLGNVGRPSQYPQVKQWTNFVCCSEVI